jgi:16S rRNA (cytosine1402-N4)-methyltransferase
MNTLHKAVLVEEIIKLLDPGKGENFIDCNYGAGGHSRAILDHAGKDSKLLAIDADANTKLSDHKTQITLIHNNFVKLSEIYDEHFNYPVSCILFDLGFSSDQLASSGRGFSFRESEPLDMRYDTENNRLTASEVLNKYGEKTLVRIFKQYGEISDKKARIVAKEIVIRRSKSRFETTNDLLVVISENASGGSKRIHPATLYFQALRIEVNKELENLASGLPQAYEILENGGRLAVISFHSLEDRIVKNYFRDLAREDKVELITKKPVTASEKELADNPRARSAKLRVIRKINNPRCANNLSKIEKELIVKKEAD